MENAVRDIDISSFFPLSSNPLGEHFVLASTLLLFTLFQGTMHVMSESNRTALPADRSHRRVDTTRGLFSFIVQLVSLGPVPA